MNIIPPFLAFLLLAFVGAVTVTGTFLGSTNDLVDSRLEAHDRSVEFSGTSLELVSVNYDGTDITVIVRNTGRVALRDFSTWDLLATYHEADGTYHPVRFTHTASNPPGAEQWTVDGVYRDGVATSAEAYQPGILDPDEEIKIIARPASAARDPGSNFATVTTHNGVRVTFSFTTVALSSTPELVTDGGSLTNNGTDIYAFPGGNSTTFWRYDIEGDFWTSLQETEANASNGGALAHANDGVSDFVYALRGAETRDFWRYSITDNIWVSLADTPLNVGQGGALVWDGADTIYALRGSAETDFWSYSISGDLWTALDDIPRNVKVGGSLAHHKNTVFALRGGRHREFYAYNIQQGGGTWERMANTPSNVEDGGALEYAADGAGDYLYALKGQNRRDFWRYDIKWDEWISLQDAPVSVDDGGSLAWDGSDTIFAFRGGATVAYWGYSIIGDTWASKADAPDTVDSGGSLAYFSDKVYAMRGGAEKDFWDYDVLSDTWLGLASTPAGVSWGRSLAYALDGNDSYVYAMRGGDQNDFWRYSIASNSWTTSQDTPSNVDNGGALTWDGADTLYAIPGNHLISFWSYSISSGQWMRLASMPDDAHSGAALAHVDGDVYALRCHDSTSFFRYNVASALWSTHTNTPATVGAGGALTDNDTRIYGLRGGTQKELWQYDTDLTRWAALPDTTNNIETGGALTIVGTNLYGFRGGNTSDFWSYPLAYTTTVEPALDAPTPTPPPTPTSTPAPIPAWWDATWQHRTKITFDQSAPSENLVGFPVLVSLTSSNVDFGKISTAGADVRFVDADQVTELAYEIEDWDDTALTATIWVKVPQIDSGSTTDHVFMYYNHSTATDSQDSAGVWSNGYVAVWHQNETTGTELFDSTSHGYDGTKLSATEPNPATAGQIGGAQDFDGSDDFVDVASLSSSVSLTLEAWIRPDAVAGAFNTVMEFGDDQPWFGILPDRTISFYRGSGNINSDVTVTLASFNYVVVTHDGSTARIWLNGAEDLPAMSLAQTETAMGFGVGFHLADDFFDGIIDEARVSNVLRSDAWTSAQHESMTNAFHTLGTEESVP